MPRVEAIVADFTPTTLGRVPILKSKRTCNPNKDKNIDALLTWPSLSLSKETQRSIEHYQTLDRDRTKKTFISIIRTSLNYLHQSPAYLETYHPIREVAVVFLTKDGDVGNSFSRSVSCEAYQKHEIGRSPLT